MEEFYVHDSGLDWLTMTWNRDSKNFDEQDQRLQNYAMHLHGTGLETKVSAFQGYVGQRFGKILIAYRPDGAILQATGDFAKLAERDLKERRIDGKATRIDYQTTIKAPEREDDFCRRMRSEVERFAATNKRAARRAFACYKNLGRDCGFVVGARSSSGYFRFYDKSVEQRGRIEPRLYRTECEFKGAQAVAHWKKSKAVKSSKELAISICKDHFEGFGMDLGYLKSCARYERPSVYEPTSTKKKLAWFQTHVSKSVAACIEDGKLEEVLETLGLTDYVRPV